MTQDCYRQIINVIGPADGDRRRLLLEGLGYSTEDLLNYFYPIERVYLLDEERAQKELIPEILVGTRAPGDIVHPKTKEVIVKKNRKVGKQSLKKLQEAGIERLPMKVAELIVRILAHDVIDYVTGEILAECNEAVGDKLLFDLRERGIEQLELLHVEGQDISPSFRNTLLVDKVTNQEEALLEIYRRLRPSNPPTPSQKTGWLLSLLKGQLLY